MKKMKKTIFGLLVSTALLPVVSVFSQGPPPIITHPQQVIGLLSSILGFVWTIMGIVVVLMLLYAGFKFVTAAGAQEEIGKAKDMVKYSLIGIVVMLLSGGIMALIENFLKGA
jgi:heme/copper-type cytochrome/quinol oxidase subunit 2